MSFSVIMFSSCGSDKGNGGPDQNNDADGENNTIRGKITIAALQENFGLANQLASAYVSQNNNVIIDVEAIDMNSVEESMQEGLYNIYFLNGLENPYPNLESQVVASDVFVLCVNFNNPVLQKLVIRGLMPSKIREIYSSASLIKWSDVVKTDDMTPVKPYFGPESGTAYSIIRSFIGINQSPTASTALNEQDLYSSIVNNTGAIGFLSSVLAFDRSTLFRAKGLYILPVDFDENKIADDKELIYDDLNILKKAVYNGGYPKGLIRSHYFVWNNDVQQKEIVNDFMNWVRENSSAYLERNGYFSPVHDNGPQE
ncbi:MAG: hypothetical protein C0592_09175 [Marinilabiliales bacterium]|nr:MAG: hypothetical protein C0592_09175 [Marinilabiliales bacterium]